jgi:hypothetical protein
MNTQIKLLGVLTDWDVILSSDCPQRAIPQLMRCDEAKMVVDTPIPWEWGRAYLKYVKLIRYQF